MIRLGLYSLRIFLHQIQIWWKFHFDLVHVVEFRTRRTVVSSAKFCLQWIYIRALNLIWNTVEIVSKMGPASLYIICSRSWMIPRSKRHVTRGCCNMGLSSETHLQLKSCEISPVFNIMFNFQIVFCVHIGHGNDTALLWARCQNDLTNEQLAMDKRDLAGFEIKMRKYLTPV